MATQLQCSSAQLQQCKEIIKSHKCSCPVQSELELSKMLQLSGVLIDNVFYSLDKQARMCAELYSKALSITWSSNLQYWKFAPEKIPGTNYTVDIAHLVNVCWLDVKGDFDTRKLSQGTEYEILFDIELTACAQGWECPVTFEYESATGKGKFEQNLSNLKGKGRSNVSIGKFMVPASACALSCAAPVSFHMYQHGDQWKNGLTMYGVIIKPASGCN